MRSRKPTSSEAHSRRSAGYACVLPRRSAVRRVITCLGYSTCSTVDCSFDKNASLRARVSSTTRRTQGGVTGHARCLVRLALVDDAVQDLDRVDATHGTVNVAIRNFERRVEEPQLVRAGSAFETRDLDARTYEQLHVATDGVVDDEAVARMRLAALEQLGRDDMRRGVLARERAFGFDGVLGEPQTHRRASGRLVSWA